MDKLVSVIIPVYNNEKTIGKTIENIMKQTYKNIEILVINDGSIDSTLDVLNKYASIDSRVKVFSQENSGPGKARNLGLEKMTGEYVTFVDADDEISEDIIYRLVSKIEQEDVNVIRYNFYYSTNQNKEEKKGELFDLSDCTFYKKEIQDKIIPMFIKNELCSFCWLLFIKKEIAQKLKFDINTKYMEDTLFYIDLLYKIDSIYFMDEAKYYYYYTPQDKQKDISFVYNYIMSLNYVYKRLSEIIKENENLKSDKYDLINLKWLNTIVDYLTIILRINTKLKFSEWTDMISKLEFNSNVNYRVLSITTYNKISVFLLTHKCIRLLFIFTKFRNLLKRILRR